MKKLIFLTAILFCLCGYSQNKDLQSTDKIIESKKSNNINKETKNSDVLNVQNLTSTLKNIQQVNLDKIDEIDTIRIKKDDSYIIVNSILKVNPNKDF